MVQIPSRLTIDLVLGELIVSSANEKAFDQLKRIAGDENAWNNKQRQASRDILPLSGLAQEIGIPLPFLTIGYVVHALYGDGTKSKEYSSVNEYRKDLLVDLSGALTVKMAMLYGESKGPNLIVFGKEYSVKDMEVFGERLRTWVLKNGGLVTKPHEPVQKETYLMSCCD